MSEDPEVATASPGPSSGTVNVDCPTVEDALALGLTRAEYELVCEKQGEGEGEGGRSGRPSGGRAPNQVELAMYSLLWSEHYQGLHDVGRIAAMAKFGDAAARIQPHWTDRGFVLVIPPAPVAGPSQTAPASTITAHRGIASARPRA